MVIANFTDHGNPTTLEEQICSAKLTNEIHDRLIYYSVLHSCLSITAFLGNTLILVALDKESSLHAPSKLLLRTLATTDLCVGIIGEPLIVTFFLFVVNERWSICRFAVRASVLTGYTLCSVSLLTLNAISVDRLLALLLGLRYRQVVTLKRTYATVIAFWALAIIGTALYFLNYLITLWYSYTVISLCLVISILSYVKIFLTLRHNQTQVQNRVHQGQPNQPVALNIARYRKTVSSALWVQLAFVVCYLPHGILSVLTTQKGLTSSLFFAWGFGVTSVYLNSSLNPILYCWKIRGVRQSVKDIVKNPCHPCL